MLRIADLNFPISSARLEAYCIEDHMHWNTEIDFGPVEFDGNVFHLTNASLALFRTSRDELDHWTDLAPRETRWKDRHETDHIPSGLLYIFEHTALYETRAVCSFDAGKMKLNVTGLCDAYLDESYDMGLTLDIETEVDFTCVWFGHTSESDCFARIAEFLNPADFEYRRTEHGVPILAPKPCVR